MGGSNTKQSTAKAKVSDKQPTQDEKQVLLAVKFLESPEVAAISNESKQAFLRNNGLSQEQIVRAFAAYEERRKSKSNGAPKPSTDTTAGGGPPSTDKSSGGKPQ